MGPRIVETGDVTTRLRGPSLRDNPETLLRSTDLVFIDPVTTGYSRPVPGVKTDEFHGFGRDRDAITEIIRLWISRHGRWLSPKFLAGESYGGLRACVVGHHLAERFGVELDGLILISPALDLGQIFHQPAVDAPFVHFLPTYTAIAHYHGLLGNIAFDSVVAAARDIAAKDYPEALTRGSLLTSEEIRQISRRLAALTGLDPSYIERARVRVRASQFFAEVLRRRGLIIGRLDGRYTGPAADLNADHSDVDISYKMLHGRFSAAANHYLRIELEYLSDLPYEMLTDRVFPWSYAEFENRPVNCIEELSALLREQPRLRVLVCLGYYDAATPFHAIEHSLAQLAIPREDHERIACEYYHAGHFMYVDENSRLEQSAHLAEFISQSLGH